MAETGWLMIAGVALVSFLTRAIFVVPSGYLRLSPGVQRVLRFAPAAALMAIIAPDMLMLHGELALSLANPRLAGGLAGFAVAAATRSVLGAITAGMVVFTLVRLAA
jgi:branched-subunit amino acid transport protein